MRTLPIKAGDIAIRVTEFKAMNFSAEDLDYLRGKFLRQIVDDYFFDGSDERVCKLLGASKRRAYDHKKEKPDKTRVDNA